MEKGPRHSGVKANSTDSILIGLFSKCSYPIDVLILLLLCLLITSFILANHLVVVMTISLRFTTIHHICGVGGMEIFFVTAHNLLVTVVMFYVSNFLALIIRKWQISALENASATQARNWIQKKL